VEIVDNSWKAKCISNKNMIDFHVFKNWKFQGPVEINIIYKDNYFYSIDQQSQFSLIYIRAVLKILPIR
jgi:hypothetical protein